MIAALFVKTSGPYFGLEGVDPWDEARDARSYAGPHAVVAHPPCERWGRYWHGGPSAKVRRVKGDDGGCFASALASLRRWGGVLEHPAHTAAYAHFGVSSPSARGGWSSAGTHGGYVCHVEQGHYGHRARKATWLYAVGAERSWELPELVWGPSPTGARLDAGFHSAAERAAAKASGYQPYKARRLTPKENIETPAAFREVLLGIARSVAR